MATVKVKKETLRHSEAFEFYYGLGESRNLKRVSEEFGVTLKAVGQWSDSFNWQERIVQRDTEISRKMQEKNINTIINEKANYRKVIKLAMGQLISDMKEGKINYNIKDLDRLIRLDMYLLGESDNNIKIENSHSISDDDRELIKNLGVSMSKMVDELGEA